MLAPMRERTTSEVEKAGADQEGRALGQRLWRNHLGIMLALALTIAAVAGLAAGYLRQ